MVGKIDKSGYLFIERGGCFERQYCPNTRKEPCGHSCPLFGEPDQPNQSPTTPTPRSRTAVPLMPRKRARLRSTRRSGTQPKLWLM